ncbi:hypothetical protein HAX54_010729 [Datura stramonium]|uniref:F-box associated beta-propeller type 1 domain-containing protein n=1 Tax=Datura stramonium TaxID=4076 RepID=A0ABS8TIJ3_DATST|nr:hypothetical protein [Datura stramonium]
MVDRQQKKKKKSVLSNQISKEFPVEESSCLGLCFDSTSGDYKILKIDENLKNYRKVPGEILALKSGSWRKIDDYPHVTNNLVYRMHYLAFIHGAFHWIGISRNYFVVTSFNVAHEVYGEISLPEKICLTNNIFMWGISVLEGMLCAYSNCVYLSGNHIFKLWVMKEYGVKESWNAIFAITDPDMFIIAPKYRFAMVKCCSGSYISDMGTVHLGHRNPLHYCFEVMIIMDSLLQKV